jgi:hypothetical protein
VSSKPGAGHTYRSQIDEQLNAAKAVVIIWTSESVRSDWVISEADHAKRQNKLVNTHVPPVKPNENIPKPFNQIHSVPLEDRQSIYAAIRKLILTPRSSLSWTAGSGKVVRTIDTQSKSVIMALLMGPDPEKIFSVTYNGEIGIWGTLTGRSLLAKDSALAKR